MKHMWLILIVFFVLPGCAASTRWSSKVEMQNSPEEGKVLVSFVRGRQRRISAMWDGETFLGLIPNRKILQCNLDPGHHLLVGVAGNKPYFLEADLEEGKHYVFVVRYHRSSTLEIVPAKGNYKHARIWRWFSKYKAVQTDPEKKAEYQEKQLPNIKVYIANYYYRKENPVEDPGVQAID